MEKQIEDYLKKNEIEYVLHKHKAVFTCAEAEIHCKNVPGEDSKNLFLKDKKGRNFFLVVLRAKKRLQMDVLAEKLNLNLIKFANNKDLLAILRLKPGSVSVLGLINDKERKTKLIIDQTIWDADIVSFHPNINTESLEFKKEEFHKLAKVLDPDFKVIEV